MLFIPLSEEDWLSVKDGTSASIMKEPHEMHDQRIDAIILWVMIVVKSMIDGVISCFEESYQRLIVSKTSGAFSTENIERPGLKKSWKIFSKNTLLNASIKKCVRLKNQLDMNIRLRHKRTKRTL